jgi:hypothetical protein
MSNTIEFDGVLDYSSAGFSIADEHSLKLAYDTRQFGIFQIRCCATDSLSELSLDEFRSEPSLSMFTKSDREYIEQTAFIAIRVFLYGGECVDL